MNLLIYDNFLIFPNKLRELALSSQFYNCKQYSEKHNSHTDWPGKRTEPIYDLYPDKVQNLLTEISNISRDVFKLGNVSLRSYFQLTTEQDGHSWVHQDNNVDLAGILYLSPNPPSNSGTTMYECKDKSKWLSYMNDGAGYETLKTVNEVDNPTLYNELFEPKDVIGNTYNRLILYKGDQYHKSNEYFGHDIETGRLTLVFFISRYNNAQT
jgi:hypothetical protein